MEQSRQPDRRRGFNFIAFSYDNLRKIPFVPQDERCNVSQDANRRRVIILFFFFFFTSYQIFSFARNHATKKKKRIRFHFLLLRERSTRRNLLYNKSCKM